MSFANPLMLAGLLAALVPILIHLINRRRPRRQPFAAIEFILRSVERVERRWRLRRFLLLAARVILLAAVALAAARPLIGSGPVARSVASGPERLAIVVDASLSMRARYEGRDSAFELAKAAARKLIIGMGQEDQATLIAVEAEPRALVARPTAARSELLAALDALTPSYQRAELADAVSFAAQSLASPKTEQPPEEGAPPRPPARVVVLSDLAGHGIRAAADLTVDDGGSTAALELIDVLDGVRSEARINRGIVGLEVNNVPGNAPRTIAARIKVRSFAAHRGREEDSVPADVVLRSGDQELSGGVVEIPPGGAAEKVLMYAFPEPGFLPVAAALEPDALAEDDRRHSVADVRRSVRTLIVDGAPSGIPKEDEIYYLDRALAAGGQDQPPRVITPDDLSREDLEGAYDVIVLAGVTSFAPGDGPRLVSYVEAGGGLWITAAHGIDVDLYNAELGRVLPRLMRGIRVLDNSDPISGAAGPVSFSAPMLSHPVLSIFQNEALSGLLSGETRAYLLLERDRDRGKDVNVLLSYEDGQPALIEGGAGRGRVVVLTTSIDRDLTDLPIRPSFLPLVRRLILHLGGALERPPERELLIGDHRVFVPPAGAVSIEVIAPDGQTTVWDRAALSTATELRFTETALPGHYVVRASYVPGAEPITAESFAVNVDPRESDLTPLSVEEATAVLLGTATPDSTPEQVSAIARLRRHGLANPEAIASALLLLMLGAFFLESVLTAQRPG